MPSLCVCVRARVCVHVCACACACVDMCAHVVCTDMRSVFAYMLGRRTGQVEDAEGGQISNHSTIDYKDILAGLLIPLRLFLNHQKIDLTQTLLSQWSRAKSFV